MAATALALLGGPGDGRRGLRVPSRPGGQHAVPRDPGIGKSGLARLLMPASRTPGSQSLPRNRRPSRTVSRPTCAEYCIGEER